MKLPKINEELKPWINIGAIMLLLFVAILLFYTASVIKTEGGKCTADPIGYSELKAREQTGEDYECSCVKNLGGYEPNFIENQILDIPR